MQGTNAIVRLAQAGFTRRAHTEFERRAYMRLRIAQAGFRHRLHKELERWAQMRLFAGQWWACTQGNGGPVRRAQTQPIRRAHSKKSLCTNSFH
jgi:hypothetical protein